MIKRKGWTGEKQRHSMAAKGINTKTYQYHEGGNRLISNAEIVLDLFNDIENLIHKSKSKLSGKDIYLTENGFVIRDLYIPVIPIEFMTESGFKGTIVAQYERPPTNFMESQGEIDYSMTSFRVKWDDGRIEEPVCPELFDKWISSEELIKKSNEQYKISSKERKTKETFVDLEGHMYPDYSRKIKYIEYVM